MDLVVFVGERGHELELRYGILDLAIGLEEIEGQPIYLGVERVLLEDALEKVKGLLLSSRG
ncbi:MAG: hypothetical protein K1Y02_24355 [Candidatus Hydrogenedentes bacterium]|nr:hypothetical protein [Candidatus Hydrogenedentota bacterium]